MICNVTGHQVPTPSKPRRGQPKRYIGEPARRYRHRVSELAGLILDLQKAPGLMPEYAARMRGELFRLGNLVRLPAICPEGSLTALGIRLPDHLLQKIDSENAGETRSKAVRRIVDAYYAD